jgi:hypothetical protein
MQRRALAMDTVSAGSTLTARSRCLPAPVECDKPIYTPTGAQTNQSISNVSGAIGERSTGRHGRALSVHSPTQRLLLLAVFALVGPLLSAS